MLTITVRSPAPAYSFSFSESHTSTNGTVTVSGSLTGGIIGNWVIDDTITPVLNRPARDWHANYFAELVRPDFQTLWLQRPFFGPDKSDASPLSSVSAWRVR